MEEKEIETSLVLIILNIKYYTFIAALAQIWYFKKKTNQLYCCLRQLVLCLFTMFFLKTTSHQLTSQKTSQKNPTTTKQTDKSKTQKAKPFYIAFPWIITD